MLSKIENEILKFVYKRPASYDDIFKHLKASLIYSDKLCEIMDADFQQKYLNCSCNINHVQTFECNSAGEAIVEELKHNVFNDRITKGIAIAALIISLIALVKSFY